MSGFLSWVKETLSDGTFGSVSRVLMITCVPPVILIPLCLWVYITLQSGQLAEIPGSIIGFMSASSTLILGNYYLAKREEVKTEIADIDSGPSKE